MSLYECMVDLVQRTGELFAVSPAPILAPDETADFPTRERNIRPNRTAEIGMLFQQRNKNLVGKLTRLAETGIGPNDDILFLHSFVDLNFFRAGGRPFCIMAEQRTS